MGSVDGNRGRVPRRPFISSWLTGNGQNYHRTLILNRLGDVSGLVLTLSSCRISPNRDVTFSTPWLSGAGGLGGSLPTRWWEAPPTHSPCRGSRWESHSLLYVVASLEQAAALSGVNTREVFLAALAHS
ncbi:hypothetical protein EJ06DRAFT_108798 [Trichodelitschia bisporula]|uniref:Uncharacterized protein n=1 Tax=Trichodelitschia bisporula TaxID=703511 RepID=A0A6G1HR99_9PEZI|nr:hypothetical protein EJ06DRAFT_108798 [Trichodelitschia bisporula]